MDAALAPVALVTGGAVRIGRAICRALAAAGHAVAVHHRTSSAAAAELCAEIIAAGGRAEPFAADLTRPPEIAQLAADVERAFGRVDVLVNNASVFPSTPFLGTPPTEIASALDTSVALHVRAPLLLVRALAPGMQARGRGVVVNLGDSVADRAGFAPYSASKAALASLTRSLARELAPEIRVNMVSPGAILPAPGPAADRAAADALARVVAKIPMGRAGTPAEIAAAVVFLVSGPGYVTGQDIAVDGGR